MLKSISKVISICHHFQLSMSVHKHTFFPLVWESYRTHSGTVLHKLTQVHGVLYCAFLLREELCTPGRLLLVAKCGMRVRACFSKKVPGSVLE